MCERSFHCSTRWTTHRRSGTHMWHNIYHWHRVEHQQHQPEYQHYCAHIAQHTIHQQTTHTHASRMQHIFRYMLVGTWDMRLLREHMCRPNTTAPDKTPCKYRGATGSRAHVKNPYTHEIHEIHGPHVSQIKRRAFWKYLLPCTKRERERERKGTQPHKTGAVVSNIRINTCKHAPPYTYDTHVFVMFTANTRNVCLTACSFVLYTRCRGRKRFRFVYTYQDTVPKWVTDVFDVMYVHSRSRSSREIKEQQFVQFVPVATVAGLAG